MTSFCRGCSSCGRCRSPDVVNQLVSRPRLPPSHRPPFTFCFPLLSPASRLSIQLGLHRNRLSLQPSRRTSPTASWCRVLSAFPFSRECTNDASRLNASTNPWEWALICGRTCARTRLPWHFQTIKIIVNMSVCLSNNRKQGDTEKENIQAVVYDVQLISL